MLRVVQKVIAAGTPECQREFRQAAIQYLEDFSWQDRQHGLTFKQKRRSVRRIYLLAKATVGSDWERRAMIREGYQIKLRSLRQRREDIRKDYVRDLRLVRRRFPARHLLRMLRA